MFTMYGDYLNMWLLYNIKTMQIYKFTHNPVLLLFVHEPDQVSGRFFANRLINPSQNSDFYSCESWPCYCYWLLKMIAIAWLS